MSLHSQILNFIRGSYVWRGSFRTPFWDFTKGTSFALTRLLQRRSVSWLVFSFDIPLCLNCQRSEMGACSLSNRQSRPLDNCSRHNFHKGRRYMFGTCSQFRPPRRHLFSGFSSPVHRFAGRGSELKMEPHAHRQVAPSEKSKISLAVQMTPYSGALRPRSAQCRLLSQMQ